MRVQGLLGTALLAFSVTALAGTAEVSWKDVDSYTDIRPASGLKDRYQQKVMDQLTEHFQGLAAKLPDDQKLEVTVTNVDLTGRVEPTFGRSSSNYVRIVREIDFPSMEFNYRLVNNAGDVLKEGQANVQNMSFNYDSLASRVRRNDLYFEEQMITRWFEKTLISQPDE
ncbi:DUF3016 domain-containing protein [Idiomarina sp. HP20-50]|uniref:DUF3016 domain-containing protein n=1 Tax=Idiomarina sp. HP20-50 TaxID=3070813 RepID=UPI00294B6055|nr:DUF3016 domain-containing protein [Idiomarina sp. HP20-50]MDV6316827.1 DUF3016 domain-containing protein [Idiomarina sp. HP20-50]